MLVCVYMPGPLLDLTGRNWMDYEKVMNEALPDDANWKSKAQAAADGIFEEG